MYVVNDWIRIEKKADWIPAIQQALAEKKGVMYWSHRKPVWKSYEELVEMAQKNPELLENKKSSKQTLILDYDAELPDINKNDLESFSGQLEKNGVKSAIEWMEKIKEGKQIDEK